jgi:tRNA A-37 threonylcarbamoyl transferase component Bud32
MLVERLASTLRDWWSGNVDDGARDDMRRLLLGRIHELHTLGVCHRDLHSENVIVDKNQIYFIDFQLS